MLTVVTGLAMLCFPTAVLGPIVSLGFSNIVRSNHVRFWFLFSLDLILAYIALFQLIMWNWGHNFPGFGYETYRILPWFAVFTGILFLAVGVQNLRTFSSGEKIGYTIGAVSVLLFQLSARFLLQIVGPILLSEWSMCSWLMQFDLPCR